MAEKGLPRASRGWSNRRGATGSRHSFKRGLIDALIGPEMHELGPAGYKGFVRLQRQVLDMSANDAESGRTAAPLRLDSGMRVTAEIHQGRRTVMEYLLSPVRRASQEAGRER
jgi:hypothetical protein